mgnify:CR=1 FL=1|jgi:hypothetical protein
MALKIYFVRWSKYVKIVEAKIIKKYSNQKVNINL